MMCLPQRILSEVAMERFRTRHAGRIVGILSGFDRLLFRGTLRSISFRDGMDRFLSHERVLYRDFTRFAERITARVRRHAEHVAAAAGRPIEYLPTAKIAKDERARQIAARDGITEGLICVFSCVEPCWTFDIRGDRATKRRRLVQRERRCIHLYFYFLDAELGLMHVRLQTWLPLTIQVCVNGRGWLTRRLAAVGIDARATENAITAVSDWTAAQRVSDSFASWPWQRRLEGLAKLVNPWLTGETPLFRSYYWSLRESEYATDVIFTDRATLQQIYPRLIHYAIEQFGPAEILRFLGRERPGRFCGEARSTLVHRQEGGRIRHWLDENSLKMYDKAGTILRVECTLNNPDRFKVYRTRPSDGRRDWLPLRRGIADLARRAALGRAATQRYLDALSVVGDPTPSHRLLDPVSQRVTLHQQTFRALRPISPDERPLLQTVARGEFAVHGFTNRDLRRHLYGPLADPTASRRCANRLTRQLRLLRAHRLIKKIPRTHRYRVTTKGHTVIATAIRFCETDIALLTA
jgi:hypothetical protein